MTDKKLEERIRGIENVLGISEGMDKFFSYPSTGGVISLPKGTNTIDFSEGKAIHADDHSKYYALSETLAEGEFVRSFAVEPDQDIIVYTDQNKMSMQTVQAGQYFYLPYQKFKKLFIDCTTDTSLYVIGHTNPDGVPKKFSVIVASPSGVGSGQTSVTTAGTAVPLSTTSTSILSVTVKANIGNVGNIFIGGSTVSSSVGFILGQGDGISLEINNLTKVYIDAANNADGCSYIYVKTWI